MLFDALQAGGVAVAAGAVTWTTTPLVKRLAARLGMQDRPSTRKLHAAVVPYLGGLAVLAGWLVAFILAGVLTHSVPMLAGMAALALLGFADDRLDLDPYLRLGIQIAVATAVCAAGVRMTPFDLAWADIAVTVFWIVAMTNAFNFMDNMDGLASGVGGIAATSLGVLGLLFGQVGAALIAFGLAGACFGFLRHNFHPAKIFMGDTGSQPIGFGIACIAALLHLPGLNSMLATMIPVVALGLFVIDTTVMAAGRVKAGEGLVGGRLDHVSHRFLASGVGVQRTALGMYLTSAMFGVIAITASQVALPFALVIFSALSAISIVGVTKLLAMVPLHHKQRAEADARAALVAETETVLHRALWDTPTEPASPSDDFDVDVGEVDRWLSYLLSKEGTGGVGGGAGGGDGAGVLVTAGAAAE